MHPDTPHLHDAAPAAAQRRTALSPVPSPRAPRTRLRRVTSGVLLFALMFEAVGPAFAVSAGYAGYVTQLPGIYTTPPDVNVMFTLDDSGSMQSDVIPDFSKAGTSCNSSPNNALYLQVPNNGNSSYLQSARCFWYPNMWGAGSSYRAIDYYRQNGGSDTNVINRASVARYTRSPQGNPLYYDPRISYVPWPTAANDKVLMANATTTAVNIHPDDPTNTGTQINLTARVGSATNQDESAGYWPATYYMYTGATALDLQAPIQARNIPANFTKYEITGSATIGAQTFRRYKDREDCTGAIYDPLSATPAVNGCTRVQELQNFANWLQYYRNRRLMAKGGVAAAFAKQATNLRVGFAQIGKSTVVRRGVRGFTGAARQEFYTQLYTQSSSNSGTPLRKAADDVGQYFRTDEPWQENPGTAGGTEYSCRRSFHILSTDGLWNGAAAPTSAATGDNDTLGTTTTTQYTPYKPDNATRYRYADDIATSEADALQGRYTISPFADGRSNTLSDVAAYYWKTDLRTSSPNNVIPSARDPAYWQHLTTFTVGLGIPDSGGVTRRSDASATVPTSTPSSSPFYPYRGQRWLADPTLRDLLVSNKVSLNWPAPSDDNPATGDDLIHAAMVGRGRYFLASDSKSLANGLASALAEAADQPLDLASVGADSGFVSAGGRVYQATFNPLGWFGRLYAFTQDPVTGIVNNRPSTNSVPNPTQQWEASHKMPAPASRHIYTSTGAAGSGTDFLWANLSTAQKAAVGGSADYVNFLRGDGSREVANGGTFRDRPRYTLNNIQGGVLGDIVNGSPLKGPDGGGDFQKLPATDAAAAAYPGFRSGTGLDNMRNSVYTAVNDGMVHAFNTANGVERFAYVPNAVYTVPRSTAAGAAENKLALLADPGYTHHFTVDGPPNISDAFVGGSWRSVLIGSNGAGARGIYALNVTNPDVPSGFGAGKFMWEFTEADNTDMGFVLTYPHVVRLRNGQWAALFGNGYDSSRGQAKLFLVDIATRAVIREFAVGTAGNNGLSQPNFVVNAEREVMAIYAGDLRGNIWKFDVSDPAAANWNVAFSGQPLFTAINSAGNAQPITVMPELVTGPAGNGVIVAFGTGKLFESTDTLSTNANVNRQQQSLYGILDNNTTRITMTAATRSTVLAGVVAPAVSGAYGITGASGLRWNDPHRGWYIDLRGVGERVNLPPQFLGTTLYMVTNTPITADPCAAGGTSSLFALDALTGTFPAYKVFDTNGDGVVSDLDTNNNVRFSSGGILTQPLFQLAPAYTTGLPTGSTVSVLTDFNRGQTSGGRPGGFVPDELRDTDCRERNFVVGTAAQSNTDLQRFLTQFAAKCATPPGKPRVSWRQLR